MPLSDTAANKLHSEGSNREGITRRRVEFVSLRMVLPSSGIPKKGLHLPPATVSRSNFAVMDLNSVIILSHIICLFANYWEFVSCPRVIKPLVAQVIFVWVNPIARFASTAVGW